MLNIAEWECFFADFATLYAGTADVQIATHSAELWAAFFSGFGELHGRHLQEGHAVNAIELMNVGHDELRNCSLLAWLLDCRGSHGQGSAFLRCFLDSVNGSSCPNGFPTIQQLCNSYSTFLESSYDEEEQSVKKRSRVDIEIDGSEFFIFIEAKINTWEGEQQLQRYLEIGDKRAGKRSLGLVFLTRTAEPPSDETIRSKVACLSWQNLGKSFLCYANTMPETHGTIIIRQICEHFINL